MKKSTTNVYCKKLTLDQSLAAWALLLSASVKYCYTYYIVYMTIGRILCMYSYVKLEER